MHLLLTDRLTCPRCGPSFGLILLSDQLDDRIVLEGRLGCPNCRDAFPVVRGFADLREPPRGPLSPGSAGAPCEPGDEDADRFVALLGIVGGPGTVALVGEPARYAPALLASSSEIHVVGLDADLHTWEEAPRLSRVVAEPGLPFFDRSLRAIGLDGRRGPSWAAEAVRAVAPGGRLVITHASAGVEETLRERGLTILVAEAETVVAARS